MIDVSTRPPAPRHHPQEEWLLGHAAGRLASVPALAVATHLNFCAQCRETVRLGETIGGILLAEIPGEGVPADALRHVLARLDLPVMPEPAFHLQRELAPGIPYPSALLGLARSHWRWLAPGIRRLRLTVQGAAAGERAYIMRVGPGKRLPEHGHGGWEATCVLAGHFIDGSAVYRAGDLLEVAPSTVHEPISGADDECICLIVSGGDIRPTGLIARLLQPLMGV